MELCNFDLHAAIQDRQLLVLVENPAAAQSPSRVEDMLTREQELSCMMEMLSQVTSGIGFMHGLGEVHRDLKPHNSTSSRFKMSDLTVLYHHASHCWKIADFGMTVEGSSTRGRTTHLRRGTPCYRAPELFRNLATFTTKVDIFAIGCIMFEFMTGKRAFAGDMEVLIYATGGSRLDFSSSRFRTSATAFLETLTYQLLNLQIEERPSATTLLQKLTLLPPASAKRSGKARESHWVIADDDALVYIRFIGAGGSGGVHEVPYPG